MKWVIYLALCLCGPWIKGVFDPRGLRPEEIWLGAIIVLFVFEIVVRQKNVAIKLSRFDLFFIAMFLSVLITLQVTSLLGLLGNGTFRNLTELLRVIKYWLIFRLGTLINLKDKKTILKWFPALAAITMIVGMLQLLGPFGISRELTAIYSPKALKFISPISISAGFTRVPGTAGNPNQYSLLLGLLLTFIWAFLITKTKELGMLSCRWFLLPLSILTVGTIIATQSRTGLVAVCIALLIGTFLFLTRRSGFKTKAWVIVVVLLSGAILYWAIMPRIIPTTRLFYLKSSAESLSYRVQIWRHALTATMNTLPLTGLGPQKYAEVSIFGELDSQYIFFLKRWGLVGATIFISFFLFVGWSALKHWEAAMEPVGFAISLAMVMSVILILAANFPIVTYESNQFMDLWLLLAGLSFSTNLNAQAVRRKLK